MHLAVTFDQFYWRVIIGWHKMLKRAFIKKWIMPLWNLECCKSEVDCRYPLNPSNGCNGELTWLPYLYAPASFYFDLRRTFYDFWNIFNLPRAWREIWDSSGPFSYSCLADCVIVTFHWGTSHWNIKIYDIW